MKKFRFILLLIFISSTSFSFGQSQKRHVDFETEDFIKTIQITFDSLKKERNLEWVYFKVARFDTAFHPYDQPPPPNFITSFGFSDFELKPEDFNKLKILTLQPKDLFEVTDSKIDSVYPKRQKKYGDGIIYSLPYSDSQNRKKMVDIEIINWDYFCGTGNSLTVELKE